MKNLVTAVDNKVLSVQAFKNVLVSFEKELKVETDIKKIYDLRAQIEFVKAFIKYSERVSGKS